VEEVLRTASISIHGDGYKFKTYVTQEDARKIFCELTSNIVSSVKKIQHIEVVKLIKLHPAMILTTKKISLDEVKNNLVNLKKDKRGRARYSRNQKEMIKNFVLQNQNVTYKALSKEISVPQTTISDIMRRKFKIRKTVFKTKKVNVTPPQGGVTTFKDRSLRKSEYIKKVILSDNVPDNFTVINIRDAIYGDIQTRGMGNKSSPYYTDYHNIMSQIRNVLTKLIDEGKIKILTKMSKGKKILYTKNLNTELNFIEVDGSKVDLEATFNGLKECISKGSIDWKDDGPKFGYDCMGKMPPTSWVTFLCNIAKKLKNIEPDAVVKFGLYGSRLCISKGVNCE